MSFRYRENDQKSRNLLDADGFNSALQSQLSGLSSVDRTQLPHGSVDETMLTAGALHELTVTQQNAEIGSPYRTSVAPNAAFPSWTGAPGLTWASYDGDTVVAFTQDVPTRGGLIQVELSTWAWKEGYYDARATSPATTYTPRAYSFVLLVNGIELDSTGNIYQVWDNVHLVGQVVAPEGSIQVQLEWRFSAPRTYNNGLTADPPDKVLFFFAGTSVLVSNRRA